MRYPSKSSNSFSEFPVHKNHPAIGIAPLMETTMIRQHDDKPAAHLPSFAIAHIGVSSDGCLWLRSCAERLPRKARSFPFVSAAGLLEQLGCGILFVVGVSNVNELRWSNQDWYDLSLSMKETSGKHTLTGSECFLASLTRLCSLNDLFSRTQQNISGFFCQLHEVKRNNFWAIPRFQTCPYHCPLIICLYIYIYT